MDEDEERTLDVTAWVVEVSEVVVVEVVVEVVRAVEDVEVCKMTVEVDAIGALGRTAVVPGSVGVAVVRTGAGTWT